MRDLFVGGVFSHFHCFCSFSIDSPSDFSSLWPKKERDQAGADVFNGISVSPYPHLLYVTGKKWNRMFLIELK